MKSILLVLSILFLGIASAQANKPFKDTISFPYETCPEVGEMFPVDCGDGLFICETEMIDVTYKQFFDNNDELIRFWSQSRFTFILFELGNPDNFLQSKPATAIFDIDYIEGTTTVTGNYAMITVPGYGQIFRDVGRSVSENPYGIFPPYIFTAGEHQYLEEDYEAVCNYLAGN